jgi:hypothetical protein
METKSSHISNDKQDKFVFNNGTPSHVGAQNTDDHTIQLFLKSACCSSRTDDPDTIIDEKAVSTCSCSTPRRSRDRFVNEDANIFQQMVMSTQDTIDETPDGWVDGYQGIETQERDNIISKIIRAQMMRYCIRKLQVIDAKWDVQVLIRNTMKVEMGHTMETVNDLFQKFKITDNVDYLIHAYTLDSPFYRALQNREDSFVILIYKNISVLKDRAFQGKSYRGLSMTEKDIEAYRWAQRRKNSIIEIRTMSSTSIDLTIANAFCPRDLPSPQSRSVICIYHFPIECQTALKLYEIPEKKLPSISSFPVENEVLLLPGTLFEVERVYETDDTYRIELSNIQVPFNDIQSALKEYDEV